MNIIVRSNDPIADAKTAPVGEVDEKKSAPVQEKEQEQKQAAESEPVENEAENEAEENDELDDESNDSDKPKAKKKGGFKRRIEKLSARISEREKEIEYWKSQALKTSEKQPAQEKKEVQASSDGKPNAENYDSHAEYVEALTDWKVQQFYAQQKQNEEKSKVQTEQQKAFQAHVDRVKNFASKTSDFEEVISDVDDIPVSMAVQEIIVTSENGPELMYELAKNRPLYESICKMSPIAAARAIGAIEAKMKLPASEEKITKKTTNAPKPISSVSAGRGIVAKSIDDPSISQREYERLRYEQLKRA